MRVLIAYGTTDGQTGHIAEELRTRLDQRGVLADAVDLEKLTPTAAAYDRIVVAGSIHVGKYQKEVARFVSANVGLLNEVPSWFVGVSMSEASGEGSDGHAEAQGLIDRFTGEHGWRPKHTVSLAGALRYREYNFVKRLVMKRIAKGKGQPTDTSRDYEFTDWGAVDRLADEIADSARPEWLG